MPNSLNEKTPQRSVLSKPVIDIIMFKIISLSLIFSISLAFKGTSQNKAKVVTSFSLVGKVSFLNLPKESVLLYDNWEIKESAICGNNGEIFSNINYKPTDWYATTVPATPLSVLVKKGIYPDPYIGYNTMKIPDASVDFNKTYNLSQYSHMPDKSNPWSKPYWFRKEFTVPFSYKGKTVWLNLDEINYRADVWVNEKQVANARETVGMFKRFRVDISSAVRPGEKNAFAISIHPLDFPGNPLHVQTDGLTGILGPNGGDADILRNVTQYCTIGWDWILQVPDRNMGIWQHVWLNATGPVKISDPAAFTALNLPETNKAAVTVRFFAENASARALKIDFTTTIIPDGFQGKPQVIRSSTTIKARSKQEIILDPSDYPALTLLNPKLWWPVTYVKQPLYRLKVEANVNGTSSNMVESKFGVRQLGTYLMDNGGRVFTVNGRTIRVTGGAWIPDFLMTWSAQRYKDEVRLMAEGNATFVRVNGCGIVPPEVFFEECDKYALLVWQDLSLTSVDFKNRKDGIKVCSPPAADSLTYIENMKDCISRLRGHASLFLWCGGNEAAPQANTGKALQNEILPQMDGTRIFFPSSNDQPEWSNIEIGSYTFGPWKMERLPEYNKLYNTGEKFTNKNEIGLTSVQNINAVAASTPDYDQPDDKWFPLNKNMGFHDATGYPMQALDKIMREDLGSPASLAEYLWWGDLYNNQSYRAIFEAANKARPRNSGTMLWKSNAAWPSFNWQIFDWYLRQNAGYYSMKSACKPLHVQLSYDNFSVQVVSTLAIKMSGLNVNIKVVSPDGKTESEKQLTANVDTNSTLIVGLLPEIVLDGKMHFVSLSLLDKEGKEIDRTVTWFQKEAKWHELPKLKSANVDVKLLKTSDVKDEKAYTFQVYNTSAIPVINVTLEVIKGSQGLEVLPSFWDDNALTLMPGEKKTVTVNIRKNQLPASPYLVVEGLNVNPVEWNLQTSAKTPLNYAVSDFEIIQKEDKSYIKDAVTTTNAVGSRISSYPLPVTIDGAFYRHTIAGIKSGKDSSGLIELVGITSGMHKINVGGMVKNLDIK